METEAMRFLREERGMEMIEWSVLGVVFALAAALLWGSLNQDIDAATGSIGACVASASCGGDEAGGSSGKGKGRGRGRRGP
jgi:Flp pilus assembly pilin Flp